MGDILEKGAHSQNEIWLKIKRACHYILTVLMYSICLIMILIFIAFVVNFIDQKRNLSSGETKPALFSAYTIVSPSMVPTINVLDMIVTMRVNSPEDLKKGDIITFNSTDYRYSGVTVTHRIYAIEQTSDGQYLFTTKGDANNTKDATRISFDDIYGKVMLRIPKVGYIQYFLSSSWGWIVAIVIPAVGIIAYDIFKLVRTLRQKSSYTKNKNSKGGPQ